MFAEVGAGYETRFAQAYEISKSTGFQVDFWISLGFLDFTWISGFHVDFLISSGFHRISLGFLQSELFYAEL